MHVTRRTVLRAGVAGAIAAGTGAGAGGCAAVAPGARRLLTTVLGFLVEGAGLELGGSLVRNAPDIVRSAAAQLPTDKGEQAGSVYGYASEFVTATGPTAGLHVAVAANYVDSPPVGDEVLSSWAVHNNVDGYLTVPAVISLGLGRFAIARKDSLLSTWGEKHLAEVYARVRQEMSVNVYERVDSDDEPGLITERAVYRVSTFVDRNIEIEWDPNERRTEQCRLTIREGVVLKGRAPDWAYEHDFAIAPYQIWDDAPAPG
jgi:hypothetical protein